MKKLSQINEHLWSGIISRSESGNVRREDGVMVGKTENGVSLNMSYENVDDGEIFNIDGKQSFHIDGINDIDIYICVIQEKGDDAYYIYEPDIDKRSHRNFNMTVWFYDESKKIKNDDFGWLRAFFTMGNYHMEDVENMIAMFNINYYNTYDELTFSDVSSGEKYWAHSDHKKAEESAYDSLEEELSSKYTHPMFHRYLKRFGYSFLDTEDLRNTLKQELKKIKDKTNIDDWDNDALVKRYIETQGLDPDSYEGKDSVIRFTDKQKLAKLLIDKDGPAKVLAMYDKKERHININGKDYYFYRYA